MKAGTRDAAKNHPRMDVASEKRQTEEQAKPFAKKAMERIAMKIRPGFIDVG
jgi:hypothetical protein